MSHNQTVLDTDPHFTIDPVSREIKCEDNSPLIVMQHDHNSQRITFDIPRYVDGHDMTCCNRVRVHYINIDHETKETNEDVYHVDDVKVSPDDKNTVCCSWLISRNATKFIGVLNFAIRFECFKNNVVEYSWGTKPRIGITVSDTIDNTDIVFEEYKDILETWYLNTVENIDNVGNKVLSEIEQLRQDVLNSIPTEYTEVEARVDLLESGKFDKSAVAQTVGNSETHVMSQKGVSDELAKTNSKVSLNAKRISNLEHGIPEENFVIDSSVAYTKDVPEDVLPYAEVTEIGGMTRKSTNIFGGEALANKLIEVAGATKDETAGTVTFSSTELSSEIFLDGCFKENTQYTFIFYGRNTNAEATIPYLGIGIQYSDGRMYTPFFEKGGTDSYVVYVSLSGVNIVGLSGAYSNDSTVLYYDKCGVFEGVLTEADFEPYFEGLRSAPVTEVESVGVNLLPIRDEVRTSRGFTITPKSDGSYVLNGTRTSTGSVTNQLSFPKQLPAGTYTISLNNNEVVGDGTLSGSVRAWFLLRDGNYIGNCTAHIVNRTLKVECALPIKALVIRIGEGIQSLDNFVIRPQVERGNTASEFKPYVRNTISIPEAVQNLDGYGEGNPDNAEEYNAIIRENGKWKYSHKGNIEDNAWTSLVSPVITDISDILPDDNYIGVEGGGTVTMVNEHGFNVPSEVVYQIDTEGSEVVTE